jgi:hypothetical protein
LEKRNFGGKIEWIKKGERRKGEDVGEKGNCGGLAKTAVNDQGWREGKGKKGESVGPILICAKGGQ